MESYEPIEKSYFTIGEVSRKLNVNPSLIRFWEKEFEQLTPRKTEKGTRKYSRNEIALLERIYQLVKVEGFTLQGAREKLARDHEGPADIEEIRKTLLGVKTFLLELKEQLQ